MQLIGWICGPTTSLPYLFPNPLGDGKPSPYLALRLACCTMQAHLTSKCFRTVCASSQGGGCAHLYNWLGRLLNAIALGRCASGIISPNIIPQAPRPRRRSCYDVWLYIFLDWFLFKCAVAKLHLVFALPCNCRYLSIILHFCKYYAIQ